MKINQLIPSLPASFLSSLRPPLSVLVDVNISFVQVGDDYAKIVVNEQNRQLAAPAASARRGPQSRPKPQPSIPPGTGAAAAAAAAAATPGANASSGSGV